MSLKEVFRSLHELFPQVDPRILKAVAIEHLKDVDAAAEFILTEVLPLVNHDKEAVEAPCTEESRKLVVNHSATLEDTVGVPVPMNDTMDCDSQAICHIPDSLGNCNEVVKETSIRESLPMVHETSVNTASDILNEGSSCLNDTASAECAVGTYGSVSKVQSYYHGEHGQESLIKDTSLPHSFFSVGGSNAGSSKPDEMFSSKDESICSSAYVNDQNLEGQETSEAELTFEGDSNCSRGYHLNLPRLSASCTSVQDSSGLAVAENLDPLGCNKQEMTDFIREPDAVAEQSKFIGDGRTDLFSFETDMVEVIDPLSSVTTRSSQVLSTDFLEEFISDAKNSKKLLSSAMESLVCMIKEIELKEVKAKEAKDAASVAGLDILTNVEELKQTLKHAKEANEMHAAEVYGEKSILATEAHELQSRLLKLSERRDETLTIIEEINQTLEERLAVAEKELLAAEQEKLEKEELAGKALKEQELVMETIVNESKRLQEEAQENHKLKEFLVDRGHSVDILQGEISVICEDVLSLKYKLENGIPLNRSSLSSSSGQPSSLSTSLHQSGSSEKSSTSNHYKSADESSSTEKLPEYSRDNNSEDQTGKQELLKSSSDKAVNDSIFRDIAADEDDWEMFDATVE